MTGETGDRDSDSKPFSSTRARFARTHARAKLPLQETKSEVKTKK